MKSHLKKTLGDTVVSYPEFQTLIARITALLNFGSLCPISSDPTDLTVLTSDLFLVGVSLTAISEKDRHHSTLSYLDVCHGRQFTLQ